MKEIILTVILSALAACFIGCSSVATETPTPPSAPPPSPTDFPAAAAAEPDDVSTEFPMESEPIVSSTPEPTLRPPKPIPWIRTSLVDPPVLVSPSIDQQVLDSDIIVVASFLSATAAVQTLPGDPGVAATYRPMQVLRFRASEYLSGTGPNEFTVEVLDDSYGIQIGGGLYTGYLTKEAAMAAASALVTQRNSTWDGRPGVLFLKGPLTPASSTTDGASPGSEGGSSTRNAPPTSSTSTTFGFVLSNQGVQSNFEYSIDTLSRTWMPAAAASSNGTRSTDGESRNATQPASTEYITDGAETPPPVISLSDLRTRIGEIDAMLAAGAGIEGYQDCVYGNLVRERWWRADPGSRITEIRISIDSGLPAESVSFKREMGDPSHDRQAYHDDYYEFWNSGPDAAYFTTITQDDDEVASNGYRWIYTIARPLPEGQYNANFHILSYRDAICMNKPADRTEDGGYSNWTVTVTAAAGTLHEAFFDPVTVGTAVKADATNGVLSPTSFTVGGTATELTSLEWSNNQVVLTLDTHVSLSGQVLEFIALDGNIALSLLTDNATVDSTAGTHTWSMSSRPWEDGDKLMLRLRPVGTEIFLQNLPSTTAQGTAHWFSAKLMNLDRSRSYSYSISADNRNVVLHNAMCTSGTYAAGDVPARSTSHSSEHPLLGCGTPGATITATLLEGTTEIDTTTYSVTVTPPPPPSVEFSELASTIEEGGNDQFVIIASHLDVAHGHTIRLTTENANMGFNATCTDLDKEFTVGSGSAAYLNSSRLYGCAAPGGTVTVTLLQGATTIGTFTQDVVVTPPPPPSLEFRNPPSTLESGQRATLRVRARELDTTGRYTIRVTTDNANMGFDSGCADRQEEDRADVGRTSFNTFFTLYGCAPPGGTVTVTLLEGVTAVNSISQAVTVTGPASTDATLSALSLSGIALTFDTATTSYSVSVANSVGETTVTATVNDDGATHVVKLGGVVDDDGTVALAVGANVITVEVTAEDGNTTQTYTVTVTRAEAS